MGFGYVFFVRPANLMRQLESMTRSSSPDEQTLEKAEAGGWTVVSSLQWLGEKMPLSPEESSFTRKELAGAGYRGDHAVAVFMGIRIACIVRSPYQYRLHLPQRNSSQQSDRAHTGWPGCIGRVFPAWLYVGPPG